jgi:hypothetical protein
MEGRKSNCSCAVTFNCAATRVKKQKIPRFVVASGLRWRENVWNLQNRFSTRRPTLQISFIADTLWAPGGPGKRNRYRDSLRAGRRGDRILVRARFSAPFQTDPSAHPASCTMGTRSLPLGQSCRGVTLTTHRNLAPRLKKEYNCVSTPPLGLHDLLKGDLYLYIFWAPQYKYSIMTTLRQVMSYLRVPQCSTRIVLTRTHSVLPHLPLFNRAPFHSVHRCSSNSLSFIRSSDGPLTSWQAPRCVLQPS